MNDTAQLLIAWGFFFLGLSTLGYVGLRFLSLILSMEVGILKEFKAVQPVVQASSEGGLKPPTETGIKDFIKNRFTSSDGTFEPYNDDSAFIQEQVENLRHQGMTEEELEAFVRQAAGTDIGKPE